MKRKKIERATGLTVAEARADITEHLHEGRICTTCEQIASIYNRPLPGPGLINLKHLMIHERNMMREGSYTRDTFTQITNLMEKRRVRLSGDWAKLRYWGLITEHPSDDEEKPRSGYWRTTARGREAMIKNVLVPKHCLCYMSYAYAFSAERVRILEHMGEPFRYTEIMERNRELTLFGRPVNDPGKTPPLPWPGMPHF